MRFERPKAVSTALLGTLLLGLCSGCVAPGKRPGLASTVETSPAASITTERDPVLDLLEYAAHLESATPEERADAVAHARRHASEAPGALNYAQLAVAFGTPGQRRYTPDEAARYAELALGADDAQWSPAAAQYLRDMARLYAEVVPAKTSTGTATVESSDQAQPVTQTPPLAEQARAETDPDANTTESARVKALERELDEAHRKLRELADIEDRLSESGS
jgi:hypothetical protein